MKPSLGRIVMFHQQDRELAPAIIVRVHSDTCVNLKVFTDRTEDDYVTSVTYGDTPYSWSWPERQ